MKGWFRREATAADPGEAWAARALAPLRRQSIDVDVTARVMARLTAFRRPGLRVPAPFPRLARAAAILFACAVPAGLVAAGILLVTGGDAMAHRLAGFGLSAWHVLGIAAHLIGTFLDRVLVMALPLLRAFAAILGVLAPLLRGTSVVAVAGGVLSILFSVYVFASARPLQGGSR